MPKARCFFVLTQGGGQHLGVEGYREKGSGWILQAMLVFFLHSLQLGGKWWQKFLNKLVC
jgi:hypothetical protein